VPQLSLESFERRADEKSMIPMLNGMASRAKRDQILLCIVARLAAELQMPPPLASNSSVLAVQIEFGRLHRYFRKYK